MRFLAFKRYNYRGQMWLPLENPEDPNGLPAMTFVKFVTFDLTDDPTAPRQVFVSNEPFPHSAEISDIRDRYDQQPLPLAVYTITSIEPIINIYGQTEAYRHQAALLSKLDFGYEGIVRQ